MIICTKITRAYCTICGWTKNYDPLDLNTVPPAICPACGDNASHVWEKMDEIISKPRKRKRKNPYDASFRYDE